MGGKRGAPVIATGPMAGSQPPTSEHTRSPDRQPDAAERTRSPDRRPDVGGWAAVTAPAAVAPAPADGTRDLRAVGVVMAAGALALPVLPDLGVTCPLRALTGVPCPLCGMTTAVVALGHGDVTGSLAANPAALVVAAVVVGAWAVWLLRRRGRPIDVAVPAVLSARRVPLALAVLSAMWLHQLVRFDVV